MNYLAHLWLAGPDGDCRAGGFLGDFVRGPLRGAHPPTIELGIRLHRRIDALTDSHPATLRALARLQGEHRRWGGVALDVLWDHYLAEDFARHSGGHSLEDFAREATAALQARRAHLPPRGRAVLDGVQRSDLLVRYRQRATVDTALARIGERARRANPLAAMGPVLAAHDSALREDFAELVATLVPAAADWRAQHGLP